jgi:hypothetical protein
LLCFAVQEDSVSWGSLAGNVGSNAVDLYNSASGTWSTAQLSVARWFLAATSVGNVTIFVGGSAGNCSLTLFVEGLLVWVDACGRWCDVCVIDARGLLFVVLCGAGGFRLMGVTADAGLSNAVDLYNGASGTWSTAQLIVARSSLAATTVGNLAIFAGGWDGNCSLTLFVEGLLVWVDACGRWCDVCVIDARDLLFVVFCGAGGFRLMRVTAGYAGFKAVDLYNSASGTWSTAQLSVARGELAATTVGQVAIFAGGSAGNCSLTLFVEGLLVWVDACGRWCDVCVIEARGLLLFVFCGTGGFRLMGVTCRQCGFQCC